MSVTVTPVSGRRDLDAFIKLPFHLYRDDPNWVPPLLYLERKRFSTGFFGFFEAYLLCAEVYRRARDGGYRWSEFSWTLEDNNAVNTIIRNVGCRKYKTYRIYEKPLSP